jgi:hypothetical protein
LVRILSSPFVAIPRIIHGHEKIHSGKLRAIGYDAARRLLRVELEGGAALEYSGVSADLWRRFTASGWRGVFTATISRMSFRRKRGAGGGSAGAQRAALDALFGGGAPSAQDSATDDGDAAAPTPDDAAPR